MDTPEELEPRQSSGERIDWVYGAIIGTFYAVAIGLQVFLVVDEMTHGALTADIRTRWSKLRAGIDARRQIDRTYRAQKPWVIHEATEATREAATGTET